MDDSKFEASLVVTDGDCWEWQRFTDRNGYGSVRWNGRSRTAHGVAWERAYGPVPDGLLVTHGECRNTRCCNPKHLEVVTRSYLRKRHALRKMEKGTRVCVRCEEELPLSEFRKLKKDSHLLTSKCSSCIREYDRELYAKHGGYKTRRKDDAMRFRYGITGSDYESMRVEQGGVCAVCGSPPKKRDLGVDHCHETGKVRGLLCDPCNLTLGHAQDDPERLEQLASYLREARR